VFEWNPIFQSGDKTFAKMDKIVKNRISHRSRSLQLVKDYFNQHPEYRSE